MNVHKLAEYFPVLEGEEFDLLVQDIKEHGQLEPIVTVGGEILDGVNRYKACQELGIAPDIEEYEGDDPLSYVISLNIRRRHLDTSQRAMLATEMLPEFEREAEKRRLANLKYSGEKYRSESISSKEEVDQPRAKESGTQAAKMFGVGRASVERAKRIKQEKPEKVADIVKGKTTVSAVDSELRQARASERAAENRAKEGKKELKQKTPVLVSEYFDALKALKKSLGLAIRGAYLFSPESKNMLITKHDELIELMRELEGKIE